MSQTPRTSTPALRKPIARRAVVRTAAWSVPAVSVAAAAPAYAASPGTGGTGTLIIASQSTQDTSTGSSLKVAGTVTFSGTPQVGRTYRLTVTIPGATMVNKAPTLNYWGTAIVSGNTATYLWRATAGVTAAMLGFTLQEFNYNGTKSGATFTLS